MTNRVVIEGRLTGDPVLMFIENEKIGTLTLAVDRKCKANDGVVYRDYVEFTLPCKVVDKVQGEYKKGDLICVKGRIENDYKMDGQRFMALIAEKINLIEKAKEGEK